MEITIQTQHPETYDLRLSLFSGNGGKTLTLTILGKTSIVALNDIKDAIVLLEKHPVYKG